MQLLKVSRNRIWRQLSDELNQNGREKKNQPIRQLRRKRYKINRKEKKPGSWWWSKKAGIEKRDTMKVQNEENVHDEKQNHRNEHKSQNGKRLRFFLDESFYQRW